MIIAGPRTITAIRHTFLRTNTSIVRASAFNNASVILTRCSLTSQTCRLGGATTRLTQDITSRFSAPRGPHFITNSVKPKAGLPALKRVSFSALGSTCIRRTHKLVSNNISLVLIRAYRSILRVGTTLGNVRRTFTRLNGHLPLVISMAVRRRNAVLINARVTTTLTVLRPCPVSVLNLGYTAKPSLVGSRVGRLSRRSPFTVSYVPGTKLPRGINNRTICHLAPVRLQVSLVRFIRSLNIRIVNNYYNAHPRRVTRLTRLTGSLQPGTQPIQRSRMKMRDGTALPSPHPTFRCIPSTTSVCDARPCRRSGSFLVINRHLGTDNSGGYQRVLGTRS